MPPELNDVTLCCIDTDHPAAGLRAVRLSQTQCRFARTVFMTPADFAARHKPGADAIDFVAIPAFTENMEYARILMKQLPGVVSTSHVLIIEWDGYVLDGRCWNPDFLGFDYIGAVWPNVKAGYRVGNGGFSLRSRRLLNILSRPEIPVSAPDDNAICIHLRRQLEAEGIKFADEATATRFSYEQIGSNQPTFGFHGVFNLCQVMRADELQPLLDAMPPHALATPSIAHLITGYAARNRWREAWQVLQKIESVFDEVKVLQILSEIADHNVENAKAARQVIRAKGTSQSGGTTTA